MKNVVRKYLFTLNITTGLILSIVLTDCSSEKKKIRLLPISGNKIVNGYDTVYHEISGFSFVNQSGDTITDKNIENKNFVAEFFFTTCEGICPIMNNNMMKVAKAFENDSTLKILSHTVKPEEDSVAALLVYANNHGANPKSWWFLTGDKKKLYSMARISYLLNSEEGDGGKNDFVHTQLFVLVDKYRHIRGFYDGTNEDEVNKLIKDILLLEKEQKMNSENKK